MGMFAQAVEKGIDNAFIQWADRFGNQIARSVTTSQIRNIYGSVKKMEMAAEVDLPELLLLKPRIAYATRRNQNLQELSGELASAIDAVDAAKEPTVQNERFRRFCQGFEAILAYHRAYGGK
jgi:CRISPR-associated protein Csm2